MSDEVEIPDDFTCSCGQTIKRSELMKLPDILINKILASHTKHLKSSR